MTLFIRFKTASQKPNNGSVETSTSEALLLFGAGIDLEARSPRGTIPAQRSAQVSIQRGLGAPANRPRGDAGVDGSGQKSKPRLTSTRGAGGSTGERSRALLPDDRRGPRRLPAPPSRRGLRMLGEHLGRPGNCAPADGISRRGELGVPVCPLSLQSGPPVGLGGLRGTRERAWGGGLRPQRPVAVGPGRPGRRRQGRRSVGAMLAPPGLLEKPLQTS